MTNEVVVPNETAVAMPTEWADRLAQFATQAQQAEAAPTGSFVTTRSGVLQWQGQAVAGNKLDVVVVDSIYENTYYVDDFDPDNPASPVCFAFAHDDKELAPHPESSQPQHDTCKGCPMNEFGSADRGKGKACKNSRRLAMVPAIPLDAASIEIAEIAFLKLPVTSTKNWANYVNTLATLDRRPPFAVVTTIGAQPDPKTQYKITFTKQGLVNDGEVLGALIKRHEGQTATPTAPYQASTPAAKPADKARGKKF
jgi:hypothetical protein